MRKIAIIKLCEMCEVVEFETNGNRKFCTLCQKARLKFKNDTKNKKNRDSTRLKLDDNFMTLDLNGFDLIPSQFEIMSSINVFSYTNHFNTNWYKILKHYKKIDSLIEAIKIGYSEYVKETGKQGLYTYTEKIGLSNDFVGFLDHDEIRKYAGTRNENKTIEDCEINFYATIKRLGRLPFTNQEFRENSEITLETYASKFNFSSSYLNCTVKKYVCSEEYNQYVIDRELFIAEVIKRNTENRLGRYQYSNEEILLRVKKVVDTHLQIYNVLPSISDFRMHAKLSTKTLKDRLNMTYSETLSYLGYNVNASGSKQEKITIAIFSKILDEKPILQATFEWLKGNKGSALRCDAYFPKHNLIVEYDGQQHFEPVDFAGKGVEWAIQNMLNQQSHDEIKNELIPQHGLKLLRVKYDEPYKENGYVESKLLAHGVELKDNLLVNAY